MHALYNTETRKLWVERSDGTTMHVGYAMDRMAAYGYLGMARLVRYSDWLPHYGPVVRCTVREEV